ncbi:hypothetical protein [Rhizobium jaguaris]|uniref:hypothetical protein n=1 Tax=Rhizobium jaguaris TaxID=1312183 RepID=UPI0013C3FAED|nr:hypothetical protein [Rhizobium jaguaris]
MKKMATAAQIARQNNISSQRSTNFRRWKRRRPVVARSGSTSFMTCSACCLMTVYEKPSVERAPVKTIVVGLNSNLRNVRPFDANLLRFLIVPHGARLCLEWEQYVSYLQHNWFFLRKTIQYYGAVMSQQWKDTGILTSFRSTQAVR